MDVRSIDDEYTVWKGKWNSANYDIVHGSITVPLKKKSDGDYTVEGVIHYKGCYNNDARVSFPIKIRSSMIEKLNRKEIQFIEFTAKIESQTIEYCLSIYKPDIITGVYRSYTPFDDGNVELRPTKLKEIDYGNRDGNWCSIM
uniref:Uncharacterized protein n=1 Tax=Pithovirus LCPAC302 TaxID=2506593 RepID=A0A481Z6A8_9VIRU|nr:MAG: hypothetical protein LCPAC302_00340 [Pithovirus LCPAC302]